MFLSIDDVRVFSLSYDSGGLHNTTHQTDGVCAPDAAHLTVTIWPSNWTYHLYFHPKSAQRIHEVRRIMKATADSSEFIR